MPNKRTLREILQPLMPNPVVWLLFIGLLFILAAVFIFGEQGAHKAPATSDVLRTIGIGAIAAAVTGIIDHNLLFKSFESRIGESLKEAREVGASLRELGVQNAYKTFHFSQIFEEAEKGETVSWLDTYCPTQNEFLTAVQEAVARKVSIRMLVIKPDCNNANHRSVELEGTPDSDEGFDMSLRTFITKMEKLASASHGLFEIRFYDDLPCVPMYLISKNGEARKGYFSIFLSQPTAHCTHMELASGEWLENMASYFDAKWARWAPRAAARKPAGRT